MESVEPEHQNKQRNEKVLIHPRPGTVSRVVIGGIPNTNTSCHQIIPQVVTAHVTEAVAVPVRMIPPAVQAAVRSVPAANNNPPRKRDFSPVSFRFSASVGARSPKANPRGPSEPSVQLARRPAKAVSPSGSR